MSELQTKIKEIQKDDNIPSDQKTKKIQELMKEYQSNIGNKHKLKPEEECTHWINPQKIKMPFISPCCNKIYRCLSCHDLHEDHTINKKMITKILCPNCEKEQDKNVKCDYCDTIYATFSCLECSIWNNIEMYHCDDCGICRIGKREDYQHCIKCEMCLNKNSFSEHTCIQKIYKTSCPLCFEHLFNSQKKVVQFKCGHVSHQHCYEKHIKYSYCCPLCRKSICHQDGLKKIWDFYRYQMILQPTPSEYKDWRSKVYCNDCCVDNIIPYSVTYNECIKCKGFNTQVLDIIKEPEEVKQEEEIPQEEEITQEEDIPLSDIEGEIEGLSDISSIESGSIELDE